eukprot:Amastigsp_a37786_4.p2 type:complete len:114 gc:universal Amastigsp_a37786_4:393-52(-)
MVSSTARSPITASTLTQSRSSDGARVTSALASMNAKPWPAPRSDGTAMSARRRGQPVRSRSACSTVKVEPKNTAAKLHDSVPSPQNRGIMRALARRRSAARSASSRASSFPSS